MNHRELEKEGVDLKLVLLLLLKKVGYIIGAAVVGAVICGGIYAIRHGKLMHERQYEAQSKYYITFEETMEKSYLDHYYNAYTWNDLLSSDWILGYAMGLLPDGYDRVYVDDCVEAEILSDVRLLTTTVKADTSEEVILIQTALEEAVVHYGEIGDKLEQIVVVRSDEPRLESIADATVRAALLGATFAAVMAVFCVLFLIAVQDAVYLPEEVYVRFAVPVAGMRLAHKTGANVRKSEEILRERLASELESGLLRLCNGKRYKTVSMEELYLCEKDAFEGLGQAEAIVLEFPQGKANSKKLKHVLWMLKMRGYQVLCAVMTEVDPSLIKHYYGM